MEENNRIPDELDTEKINSEGKNKNGFLKELYEWVSSIAIAVVLALVINQFLFAMVQVDGQSMEPTLYHGERLIVRKILYTPEKNDVVIIKSNVLQKFIVKRVVALPGQTVSFDENMNLLVDGEIQNEPFINEKQLSSGNLSYPLTVPDGYYFVLGDNRNHSTDSRSIGLISEKEIVGESFFRLLPFDKMGKIE